MIAISDPMIDVQVLYLSTPVFSECSGFQTLAPSIVMPELDLTLEMPWPSGCKSLDSLVFGRTGGQTVAPVDRIRPLGDPCSPVSRIELRFQAPEESQPGAHRHESRH